MVLGVILGAVFGAVFGYIIGWIIELFPNFNAALLDGLQSLTGISGVKTTALLAAIGFLAGLISGLIRDFTKR